MIATAILIIVGTTSLTSIHADAECYDVEVRARPIRQTPGVMEDCGANCVITRWPWFVDLDVAEVIQGELRRRRVTVLTLQHTYRKRVESTWLLRRHAADGFNVVVPPDGATPAICPPGGAPAEPYLRPGVGQFMDDVRAAAERRYVRSAD